MTTNDSAEVTEPEVTGTEVTETDTLPEPPDPVGGRSGRGAPAGATSGRGARAQLIGALLLAVALLASAGAAAWLYFQQYRPDQETNAAVAGVALDAAKNGTVALLSYAPETLDKDFAAAKSHLTGDFLSYYTQFTEQIVTPAAKQKSVKTAASVVQAAVSELHPDSAVVLVFVNQSTTSKENPDGAFAASAVKVGLKKINGAWLISSFDPV